MVPKNGFYVREIIRKEIEEIYNVRKVSEVYATEIAIPRINSRDIAKAEKIFNKAKRNLGKNKFKIFIEANIILHKLLVDNCVK